MAILKRIITRPDYIWSSSPVKKLTFALRSSAGRNNLGRITSFHKGGGVKKRYRFIDFKRQCFDTPAIVRRLEYDPARSAFIALLCYYSQEPSEVVENPVGILSYIIAPSGLNTGDFVLSSRNPQHVLTELGCALPLKYVTPGLAVSSVELHPNRGACFSRAAGCFAIVLRHTEDGLFSVLRLSSGEERVVSSNSLCTVGAVSNEESRYDRLGKAGVNRRYGRRPIVRGVAMNPIDHPHGGGQGKSTAGRHPVSPWGVLTKGFRTVRNRPKSILKSRFS